MANYELQDWDLEGIAYRDGEIVDFASVMLVLRRLAVVEPDPTLPVPRDENGNPTVVVDANGVALRTVSEHGPWIHVRVPGASLTQEQRDELCASWQSTIRLFATIGISECERLMASPDELDRKITEATTAQRAAEEARLAKAAADQATTNARDELASLEAQIASKRAELSASAEVASDKKT